MLWLGFLVGVFSLLCFTPSLFRSSFAAVVWSDDFNDGDYLGWTTTLGAFSAAENTFRGDSDEWNYAYHSSTIAEGTWHFDVYHSGAYLCPYVWIITNDLYSEGFDNPYNGYYLHFTLSFNAIQLCRDIGMQGIDTILDQYHPPNGIQGWWHLDITRDSTGHIYGYINDTLRLEAQDTHFDTSQYFYFECYDHHAVDNVIVSNTIDIEPPTEPPTTPTTPTTPAFTDFIPIALIIALPITIGVIIGLYLLMKFKRK